MENLKIFDLSIVEMHVFHRICKLVFGSTNLLCALFDFLVILKMTASTESLIFQAINEGLVTPVVRRKQFSSVDTVLSSEGSSERTGDSGSDRGTQRPKAQVEVTQ